MLGRLEDPQIEDLLRTATIGRIGCRDDDSVYVVPISFVFDNGCVYGRSAEGRKLTLMRAAPDVCFEVEDVRGLSDWRSVVARGRFEELHGDDARAALDLLTSRFAVPMSQPDRVGPAPSHGHGTSRPPVLFRIRLQSCTGRFGAAAPGRLRADDGRHRGGHAARRKDARSREGPHRAARQAGATRRCCRRPDHRARRRRRRVPRGARVGAAGRPADGCRGVLDIRLGVITWLVAAAHEIPCATGASSCRPRGAAGRREGPPALRAHLLGRGIVVAISGVDRATGPALAGSRTALARAGRGAFPAVGPTCRRSDACQRR